MVAFSSPIWTRCWRNRARRRWFSLTDTTPISGTQANTASVSGTLA